MKKRIILVIFSILILISYGCKKNENVNVVEEKSWNTSENTIINELNDVYMYDNLFIDIPTWESTNNNGVIIFKSEKAIIGLSVENSYVLDQIKSSLGANIYYADKSSKNINGFDASIKEYTISYVDNMNKPLLDYSLSRDNFNINFVIVGLKNATIDEVYEVSEEFINRIKVNIGE